MSKGVAQVLRVALQCTEACWRCQPGLACWLAWDSVRGGTGASGVWFFTMVVDAPCRSACTYTSPLLRLGAREHGVLERFDGKWRSVYDREARAV